MTEGPFPSDAAARRRLAELRDAVGGAVERDLRAALEARQADPLTACTIDRAAVDGLVRAHGLASPRGLALLAVPVAAPLARAPISDYRVGVVGIDDEGDLVFGANLEFPGADLVSTIHAEGFVSLRARARRRRLSVLAMSEAHPCAHCRQTLSESSAASELELIDWQGHGLRLADLYPWSFTPAALGVPGDDPRTEAWPSLELDGDRPPEDVAGALLAAGRRAHAPYSGCPSAAVLRLRDGRLVAGSCVESVSFNPTITALQAALVELVAVGLDASDVDAAWLGRLAGGTADPEAGARGLLRAVAPHVELSVVDWRMEAAGR